MNFLITSLQRNIFKNTESPVKKSAMKGSFLIALAAFALVTAFAVFGDYAILFANTYNAGALSEDYGILNSNFLNLITQGSSVFFVYFGCFALTAAVLIKTGFSHGFLHAKELRSHQDASPLKYALLWAVPATLLVIASIVYCCVLKYTLRPLHYIICFLIFTYMRCAVEEYAYRGILAESLMIKHRETRFGIVFSTVITGVICGLTTAAVFKYKYNVNISVMAVVSLMCVEAFVTVIYYFTANIHLSLLCRFLVKLAILIPCGFFAEELVAYSEEIWFSLCLIPVLVTESVLASSACNKIIRLQSDKIIKLYSGYGIKYKKHSNRFERSGFKKYMDESKTLSGNQDVTVKYIGISLATGALTTFTYWLILKELSVPTTFIPFVRENGLELMVAQLSTTFLIVSFLSFLTSRDDYILWIDTMSYKLIFPEHINFISLSVYAFASMALSAFFYCLKWDLLMLLFFFAGFGVLTFLTFRMVKIFFNRSGLITELEVNYCQADFQEKLRYISDLYKNTCHVIANNDCQRIQENFNFLSKLYFVYSRQALCLNASTMVSSEEAMKLKLLSLVPDGYKHFIYNSESGKYLLISNDEISEKSGIKRHKLFEMQTALNKDYKSKVEQLLEMRSRVKDELIYFVATLLTANPMLLSRMLDGYNGRLLEIKAIRDEIVKYIDFSLKNPSNKSAIYIMLRDVLPCYLSSLEDFILELPLLCNREKETMYKTLNLSGSNYLYDIQQNYDEIRRLYPDDYEAFYNDMTGFCDGEYKEALEFAESLKLILAADDDAVAPLYTKWCDELKKSYDGFSAMLLEDRDLQTKAGFFSKTVPADN